MKCTGANLGCPFSSTHFFNVPAGSPVVGGRLVAVQGQGKERPEKGGHVGQAGGRFNTPPNSHGRLVLGDHGMRESLRQNLAGLQKLGPGSCSFQVASARPPSGCGNSGWTIHSQDREGVGSLRVSGSSSLPAGSVLSMTSSNTHLWPSYLNFGSVKFVISKITFERS